MFTVTTNGHIIVAIFTVGLLVIIGILEIFANFNEEIDDNLNFIMNDCAEKYYYVPYTWGIIGGHFFFGSIHIDLSTTIALVFISVSTLLLMIYDLLIKHERIGISGKLTALILGFLAGHFVWSMNGIANV